MSLDNDGERIDMAEAVRRLKQIRALVPEEYRGPLEPEPETAETPDVHTALRLMEQIRASIPEKYRVRLPPRPEAAHRFPATPLPSAEELELFDLETVQEGMQAVLEEVAASVDYARRLAIAEGLKVYYAAVELAEDPEHADLIPHLAAMREAYEREFGEPIPPAPERE